MSQMTPQEIVHELDKFIIGQQAAKRAVAIALRNRWRRQQVLNRYVRKSRRKHSDDRPDWRRQDRNRAPPGKTGRCSVHQGRGNQIYRGYGVGRDVDSIIRDLVEIAIKQTRETEARKSAPSRRRRG